MHKPTAVLILFAGTAAAQQFVSVGVKGGISLTEHRDLYNDQAKNYVVGPSIEFRLPFRFAAEIDALYMRVGSSYTISLPPGTGAPSGPITTLSRRERGNAWEFPVLGKYYFTERGSRLRPFLGTGYSFRTTWFHDDFQSVVSASPLPPQIVPTKNDFRSPFQIGATFTGGVRFQAGRIAITPEFRYIRWSNNYDSVRKNDAKFLLGISF